MILGMTTYTLVHVVLSLIGIGAGLVVVLGLLTGKRLDTWTAVFLATTALTSATGNASRDLGGGPTPRGPSWRSI
jgi:hypothetical protein